MKFSSKEDIEAPIAEIFSMLSEFDSFERSAIRRGMEVQRTSAANVFGLGMTWSAQFQMRGKTRDMDVELVQYDAPNVMRFVSDSQGVDGVLTLELMALSPRRTRMTIALELSPKTLAARLLIQSLKLAKSNLTKRFKLRAAGYARDMEDRHKRTA